MLTVKNKRTGVVGTYPKRQAEWLVSTGRCELVAPDKPKPSKSRQKAPHKEPDAVASQEKAVEVQAVTDPAIGGETSTQDSEHPQTDAEDAPEQ